MRILVLTPEIPFPVFKGNQNRINETLHIFLRCGWPTYVAALNFNQKERRSIDVERDLRNAYPGLAGALVRRHPKFDKKFGEKIDGFKQKLLGRSKQIANYTNCPSNFRKAVGKVIRDFKPTHIVVNYAKLSAAVPSWFSGTTILDMHDVQSSIMRAAIANDPRKLSSIDITSFENEEFNLLKKYDYLVSINKNETEIVRSVLGSSSKIVTVPAFMDAEPLPITDFKYDLLFVGSGSPFNVEGIIRFVAKAFPIIRKKFPNVKLAIAGEVSNASAVKKINLPNNVHTLGRVGDLGQVYAESRVVLSPIISGAGMKVKNIEAMAYGKALVATTFSMDGIDAEDGKECLIRDDWSEFAQAVITLLTDERARIKLEHNVLKLAREKYSKEAAAKVYCEIFDQPLESYVSVPGSNAKKDPLSVSVNKTVGRPVKKRIKGLIFSTDAYSLMLLNIELAKVLWRCGVYVEFVKMEEKQENVFLDNGFLVHAVRSRLSNRRRDSLKKEFSYLDENPNGRIIYAGIDWTDDLKVYREMFPAHFSKSPFSHIVAHGVLIVDAIVELVKKNKYDFLVGWNGNGPHFIFLMKIVAKICGIPIFHVERGLLPGSVVFDARGVNFKSTVAGSFLPIFHDSEKKKAINYINKYRKQSRTIVETGADSFSMSASEVRSHLGLHLDQDFVFFPMQIEGDSNIILNSPIYKKMSQVLDDLINVCRKLGLAVIVRPHPENKGYVPDRFEGCVFDTSLHLHTLLRSSFANVVINSTVGLESILLGRPTIALGHSVYSGKGITYDAYHSDHIEAALASIREGDDEYGMRDQRLIALLTYLFNSSLVLFEDQDLAEGSVCRTLMTSGIYVDRDREPPLHPMKARRYFSESREKWAKIRQANRLKIVNLLDKGTRQYMTGASRPEVTKGLIVSSLKRKIQNPTIDIYFSDDARTDASVGTGYELTVFLCAENNYRDRCGDKEFVLDEYLNLISNL